MKVSVCMTTYNQQDLISDAIEGVLAQKTNFPIELHIGDDCSTDDTGSVCLRYAEKFPETIKYHRRPKNLGMMPNFIETLSECDGDYVAWCEGDDYWIDSEKLQIQVDFLESNPDFSMAAHNHFVLADGKLEKGYTNITDDFRILETEDYLLNPHFQTASYLMRRSSIPTSFPEWYKDVFAGDHFLVLLLSLRGKIAYFNRRMSVFRTYNTSVTGTRGPLKIKQNFVEHLSKFDRETDFKFNKTIETVIGRWNLGYKVYESESYLSKLRYFIRHIPFYLKNFDRVGGLKLPLKYLAGVGTVGKIKNSFR